MANIPQNPPFIFANKGVVDSMVEEAYYTFLLDHCDFPATGGIFRYFNDSFTLKPLPFPCKGWPHPEAVFAINIIKKMLLESLKHPLVFLRKNKAVESFNSIAMKIIKPHLLHRTFMTNLASELGSVIAGFMVQYGIRTDTAFQFARIIESVFECDDAYRYRLEDIFSETSKEALIFRPRKEILRLIDLWIERENASHVPVNMERLRMILSVALLSPKIKKAIRQVIKESNFEKLQLDDIDRYWCSLREDYDFFGTKLKDRGVTLPGSVTVPH